MIGGILDREIKFERNFSFPKFKLSNVYNLQDSFGCVNAVKITKDLILTGGDDKRILLYNQDLDLTTQFKGHISNVFSVNTVGNKIYSTGNDGYLVEYDVNQTSRFGKICVAHEDAVHNFAIQSNNIILTAGQDFCCKLWDVRVEDAVGVLETIGKRQNCVDFRSTNARGSGSIESRMYNDDLNNLSDCEHCDENYPKNTYSLNNLWRDGEEFTDNPKFNDALDGLRHRYTNTSHITNQDYQSTSSSDNSPIFLTCDDQGGIYLYDIRTGFTSKHPTPLKSFNTRLGRIRDSIFQKSRKLDISSARFSPDGDYIACTIQKFSPLLFSVWEGSDPIAVLQGDGYSSLTTIKSGDFSTTINGLLYFAGGDDGNVYGWRIPRIIDKEGDKLGGDLFFTSNEEEVCQPPVINESVKLIGNGSIVNSVSCHPSLPYVIISGVEKVVRLYAPHDLDTRQKDQTRDVRTEPDEDTLEFFQMLVRRERFAVENYLWRRFRADSVSITDEGSDLDDSDGQDSDWNSSSSDDGLLMEEYDNDSNISAE